MKISHFSVSKLLKRRFVDNALKMIIISSAYQIVFNSGVEQSGSSRGS